MPKLPRLSAKELISYLKTMGFEILQQRGSHIKLKHPDGRIAIVPNHKQIKLGTLKKGILNPLSISTQDLLDAIKIH